MGKNKTIAWILEQLFALHSSRVNKFSSDLGNHASKSFRVFLQLDIIKNNNTYRG